MDRAQVNVVLLAYFGELGIEVDLVLVNKGLESGQVIVEDTVIEFQAPALTSISGCHVSDEVTGYQLDCRNGTKTTTKQMQNSKTKSHHKLIHLEISFSYFFRHSTIASILQFKQHAAHKHYCYNCYIGL